MKPEEKAKQLVDKYLVIIIFGIRQNIDADCFEAAKQSALLCVDEIRQSWSDDGSTEFDMQILYWWGKVKEEITRM